MSSGADIPEHIPPYKLVIKIEAYDPNPDTAFMRLDPNNARRYKCITPMKFCPGFRKGLGWGFEFYHHEVYPSPDQPLEFCTYAFSVLIPLMNRLDLSQPINRKAAKEKEGRISESHSVKQGSSYDIHMRLNPATYPKENRTEIPGLISDEDTIYVRCPHGMTIFKLHREPVTCPRCGEKPLYVEKYDRWYCTRCDKYTKPIDKSIAWPAKDRAPNEPAAAPEYWP